MVQNESELAGRVKILDYQSLGSPIGTGTDSSVYRIGDTVLKLYDRQRDSKMLLGRWPQTDVVDLHEYQETTQWFIDFLAANPCEGSIPFRLPGQNEITSFHYDVAVTPIAAVGRFAGIPAAVSEYVPGPNMFDYLFNDVYTNDPALTDEENEFFAHNKDQAMAEYLAFFHDDYFLKDDFTALHQASPYLTKFFRKAWHFSGVSIAYVNIKLHVDLPKTNLHVIVTDLYGHFRARTSNY